MVDESGLSERPHRCRTWAPRGETPGLEYHFNGKTLSAMAGVTWWNFYFRLFPGAIRSPQVVEFREHLQRHLSGKLLIVWDGLRSHRSRIVGEYVRRPRGRVWLEFLPAYAPELNPGGILVVALEATRATEPLPERLLGVEPSCAKGTTPDAPAAYVGDGLLGTSRALSVVTILCEAQ